MIMIFMNEPMIEDWKQTYLWLSNDCEYILYVYKDYIFLI